MWQCWLVSDVPGGWTEEIHGAIPFSMAAAPPGGPIHCHAPCLLTATLQAAGGSGQWRRPDSDTPRRYSSLQRPNPTQRPVLSLNSHSNTDTCTGRSTSTPEICTVAHQVRLVAGVYPSRKNQYSSSHPTILGSDACLQRKLPALEPSPPEQL